MQPPIEKALWFIESHFAQDISLDAVASACGVSRFQMSRVFSDTIGLPVTRYVRGRRLTEAARELARGAPDILSVALDAGYNSHEAFTRAFRDQFGLTPAEIRARRALRDIPLVEPLRRDRVEPVRLPPPRFETLGPLSIAGLAERFARPHFAGIPALWQRFHPYIGAIPGQIGTAAYGLCASLFARDGGHHYLAGVEVADLAEIPRELVGLRLPAQRYAVFPHQGHVTEILGTTHAIWNDWFPRSGHRLGAVPDFFERYGEAFDPWTGSGGFEIWIPLKG